MSEQTIYQQDGVSITTRRAMMGGKTFALDNITTVESGFIPPSRTLGVLVLILGIVVGICSFFTIASKSLYDSGLTCAIAVVGVMIFIIGIAILVVAKPTYTVRITTSAGQSDALVSKNREQIDGIIEALNRAIATARDVHPAQSNMAMMVAMGYPPQHQSPPGSGWNSAGAAQNPMYPPQHPPAGTFQHTPQPPYALPAAPVSNPRAEVVDTVTKLERLKSLKDQGILSEAEYEAKRMELLSKL